ncbi:MAG: fibronectin type III domain-containing protein [bacterium]|nr:fibronectin type III domain-containing protein [bacterium]
MWCALAIVVLAGGVAAGSPVAARDGRVGSLLATLITSSSVEFRWPEAAGADGYRVSWRPEGDAPSAERSMAVAHNRGLVSGLAPSSVHIFEVEATRGGVVVEGSASAPLRALTLPAVRSGAFSPTRAGVPTLISVTPTAAGIRWPAVAGVGGYVVSWWREGTPRSSASTVFVSQTTHTVAGLLPGTVYLLDVSYTRSGVVQGEWTSEPLRVTTLGGFSLSGGPPPQSSDSQSDPVVSVSAGAAVAEGAAARFTLTAAPPPERELTVSVTVAQTGAFVASDDLGAQSVTVPASGSATFSVATVDDGADEPAGAVTAKVGAGTGYTVAGAPGNEASVPVRDGDPTTLLWRAQSGTVAEAGGTTEITIALGRTLGTGARVMLPLSVTGASVGTHYTLAAKTGTGTNVGVTVSTSDPHSAQNPAIVFTAGARVATLVLTALANTDAITRTVTVTRGTDRQPEARGLGGGGVSTAGSASVRITNDDVGTAQRPIISIAPGAAVTEGTDASFTLTASPAPAAARTVRVTVTQTGAFVAPGDLGDDSVVFSAGTASVSYTVPTDGDHADETDGSVKVTLGTGTGYTIPEAPHDSASVAVSDDDERDPVISITAGPAVTEGTAASFTVTADPKPARALKVKVTVTQKGAFVAPHHRGAQSVTVPASGSVTYKVPTSADSEDEPHGSATVTLNAGTGYTIAKTPKHAATVTVKDDDADLPQVSIKAGAVVVIEGTAASFTITATPPPAKPLSVSIQVTAPAGFVTSGNRGLRSVTVPTSGTFALTVPTVGDNVDEANGSVIVAIRRGGGYTVGLAEYAYTRVHDDDVPEVAVAAGAGVTEGTAASFTITASPAPARPVRVHFTVAQTGTFVANSDRGSHSVMVPAGGSVDYEVPTVNDQIDEQDGSVSLTIRANIAYTVAGGGNNAASVAVSDNDGTTTPTVSVAAGPAVNEGVDASFTVTASPAPAQALTVKLTVAQTGSFVGSTNLGSQSVTVPTKGWAVHPVPTVNDSAGESNGRVTVTLGAGQGYTVAKSPGDSASVKVRDNDNVAIALAAAAGDVAEYSGTKDITVSLDRTLEAGQSLLFQLSFSGATAGTHYSLALKKGDGVNVGVSLNTGAPYSAQNPALAFGTGASVATLVLTALPWSITADTTVTVGHLLPQSGAWTCVLVGNCKATRTGTASVTITNDDSTPTASQLSIAAGPAAAEGAGASFTITAHPVSKEPMTVSVTVAESGTFVAAGKSGSKTLTIAAGTAETLYTVGTDNDKVDEPDGSVTVTLNAGTDYVVASGAGAATATVTDDDATTVNIRSEDLRDLVKNGLHVAGSPKNSTDITITLGRAPMAGETVTVPLTVTGTAAVTSHYTLALKTDSDDASLNRGVSYVTSGSHSAQNPAVVFAAGAVPSAVLVFTAVSHRTLDVRDVKINFGTGQRAPSVTGSGGGTTTSRGITPQGGRVYAVPDFNLYPAPIAKPTISGETATSLTVNWSSRSGAEGYEIRYRAGSGGPIQTTTVASPGARSHTLTGLTSGTAYRVWVRIILNGTGESWSQSLPADGFTT